MCQFIILKNTCCIFSTSIQTCIFAPVRLISDTDLHDVGFVLYPVPWKEQICFKKQKDERIDRTDCGRLYFIRPASYAAGFLHTGFYKRSAQGPAARWKDHLGPVSQKRKESGRLL